METTSLIHEIEQLPFTKQMFIAEWIIKNIRQRERKGQLKIASEKLYKDYLNDEELTIFTDIDFENFYETAK